MSRYFKMRGYLRQFSEQHMLPGIKPGPLDAGIAQPIMLLPVQQIASYGHFKYKNLKNGNHIFKHRT